MEARKNHATNNPFKHALDGLAWGIKTQPNYRVHFALSIVAILLSVFFQISILEWIIIFLLITIGLVIEAFNTAIESTNDAITKEWKKEIKIAKDMAAAAMLTYAIGVLIIGMLIFGTRLMMIVNL